MSKQRKKNDGKEPSLYELTDIDTKFVSLVTAGANRQKNFMIIKADEQGKEKDGDPVQQEEQGAGDAGESETEGEKTNLSSWLNEAGTRAEDMVVDASIAIAEASLASEANSEVDTGKNNKAQKVGKQVAPLAGEQVKEIAKLEKEMDTVKTKLEKSEAKINQLAASNVKSKRELKALRASNARLRKGIGGTTSLVTGEIIATGEQKNTSGEGEPWAHGGDMAK